MMDPDLHHIVLNLNKCSFEATVADVKKLDPNIINIKNYKPGSFAITIDGRVKAIKFV